MITNRKWCFAHNIHLNADLYATDAGLEFSFPELEGRWEINADIFCPCCEEWVRGISEHVLTAKGVENPFNEQENPEIIQVIQECKSKLERISRYKEMAT